MEYDDYDDYDDYYDDEYEDERYKRLLDEIADLKRTVATPTVHPSQPVVQQPASANGDVTMY